MRAAVIINPTSGPRGRRSKGVGVAARVELARRVIVAESAGAIASVDDVEVDVTRAAGHARELARAHVAAGMDLVIAWGGDGTVNEVAGPLIGTRTALGIVPSGSGDGLAGGLGLPREPEAALRLALSTPASPMDTAVLGDRHFLNIAGIGFDAAVAATFNRSTRRGLSTYVMNAIGEVWGYRIESYGLELDGIARPGRYFVIAFSNGPQYGNGLGIAPDSDPFDGQLDLVLVDDGSPLAQCWRARRLFITPRRPAAGVLRQRIRTATVDGARLVCHVDGETFETAGRLDVRVRPASLLVALPRAHGAAGVERVPLWGHAPWCKTAPPVGRNPHRSVQPPRAGPALRFSATATMARVMLCWVA